MKALNRPIVKRILNTAICQGLDEEEILLLLDDRMSLEKMKELCDLLLYFRTGSTNKV